MLQAAVDIGTNSVLLLIAKVSSRGIQVVREEQELPRLGRGVDQTGILHEENILRVLTVLNRYRKILSETDSGLPFRTVVSATSAVRDAENRAEFIDRVNKVTGWKVRLLSGKEEAVTTYSGALRMVPDLEEKPCLVIDIGGGSTEFAYGKGEKYLGGVSIDMGSVRFTERYLPVQPPTANEITMARETALHSVEEYAASLPDGEMVGVAGTVTTLAGVIIGMDRYDIETLNGYYLTRNDLEAFIEHISELNREEIEKINPLYLKGRSDIILAGAMILEAAMNVVGKERVMVSTGGIRHGLLQI